MLRMLPKPQKLARFQKLPTFLALAFFAPVLALTACSTASPPSDKPISITLGGTTMVDGGQTLAFFANLTNDFQADGATFTLSGPGTLTYPPVSLLSSPKLQCFYTAPTALAAKTAVTLTATSVKDPSKSSATTITVYPTVVLAKFSPMPQPQAGVAYSFNLAQGGSGGAGPLTFVLLSGGNTYGPLPPGLTLSADGVVSGTPTSTGTYTVSIQAQDRNLPTGAGSATQSYTFVVS